MPTCPICNAKIDFLISWCYEYHAYKFVLKGNFDNPRFDKTRFEIEITKRRQFGKTQISYSGKN